MDEYKFEGTPHDEWLVEVTWAEGTRLSPVNTTRTSDYGPFPDEESRDRFIADTRMKNEVESTRVKKRRAYYTPWQGPEEWEPVSAEERERLKMEHYTKVMADIIGPRS